MPTILEARQASFGATRERAERARLREPCPTYTRYQRAMSAEPHAFLAVPSRVRILCTVLRG